MSKQVRYAVVCHPGTARNNNEDNYYCCGHFLPEVNRGMEEILTGTSDSGQEPMFAVFDGMGGADSGEKAAYLAAEEMGRRMILRHSQKIVRFPGSPENQDEQIRFLEDLCSDMNRAVLGFASAHNSGTMGTTVAGIWVQPEYIYGFNVGDSRIYRVSNDCLTQISRDHSVSSCFFKKPLLTQHIGMDERDYSLEPHIVAERYVPDRRYLICSDGLLDTLKEDEVFSNLQGQKNITSAMDCLMAQVRRRGAADNTTVVFLELSQ